MSEARVIAVNGNLISGVTRQPAGGDLTQSGLGSALSCRSPSKRPNSAREH